MAILDSLKKKDTGKKETGAKKKAAPKETAAKKSAPIMPEKKGLHIDEVIKRPRITEKAAISADDRNAYAFEVDRRATKRDVAAAIARIYEVTPVRVNIINTKPKEVFRRNKKGVKSGFKKAIVFLKDGDKIEFV